MVDAFSIKIPENAGKRIFREKRTRNKIPLMFLDVKMLMEREQLRFSTVYFPLRTLKVSSKKGQKGKTRVSITFFEGQWQQDRCR